MTQGLLKYFVAQRTGHQIPCDFALHGSYERLCLIAVALTLHLVNHLGCWAHTQSVWFRRSGRGLRICLSHKLSGVADACPGTLLGELLPSGVKPLDQVCLDLICAPHSQGKASCVSVFKKCQPT